VFASIEEIEGAVRRTGYIADPITITTVYLAARLHKPLAQALDNVGRRRRRSIQLPNVLAAWTSAPSLLRRI